MKADNNSLTDKDRDHLKTTGYNLLVRPSHLEFLKYMEAFANPANIELMIKGMQSVPKVYGNTGFEIRLWDHMGTFETPWFGGYYQEKYYKSDKDHHYVLELPDNLSEQVGDGKLVIELEVDIRGEEGWLEEVEYSEGSRYKMWGRYGGSSDWKTWEDAEAHCVDHGGQLTSIRSEGELSEVIAEAGDLPVWIGGADEEAEGRWSWIDGSKWVFTSFYSILFYYQCVQAA